MLKCSVKNWKVSKEMVRQLSPISLYCNQAITEFPRWCCKLLYIFLPGATPLSGSQIGGSSGPVFLSSLHCTDEDHSLLDDCAHSQLGLAVCDEDSGLAGAKCLGKA